MPLARNILFFCLLTVMTGNSGARAETLPDIDVHEFRTVVIRKSQSGRVYLIQVPTKDLPKTGNIVLIQNLNKPVFALRVLQTDELKGEFIAKRVRRYDETAELVAGQDYLAIEKVADVLEPPPP